jgi:hypothetical protein
MKITFHSFNLSVEIHLDNEEFGINNHWPDKKVKTTHGQGLNKYIV